MRLELICGYRGHDLGASPGGASPEGLVAWFVEKVGPNG